MTALVAAILIFLLGGAVAFCAGRSARASTFVGATSAVAGSVLGIVPVVRLLAGGADLPRRVLGESPAFIVALGLDALSAFFLVPVFVLGAAAALYGAGYMRAHGEKKSLGPAWFAFNALMAGMTLVVLARDAVLFLVAWEAMSLAAWVLVSFDHEQVEVRRAGWIYLIAAHFGVAVLFGLFLLIIGAGGSSLDHLTLPPGSPLPAVLFALALAGFGVKAGFIPLHVWLPEAHAAAPSHVSALLSGVMIKLGLYGILRIAVLIGHPAAWWGPVLILIGFAGAVMGITLALSQRDLKRSLAYSSIENVGLITLGLGLGFHGWSSGRPGIAAIGFAGGFLHIWNHTAMKGLMFFGAGSVLHGTGTRDVEKMGGLMKRMPRTGVLMALGAVAISALPPMNGFVSEWLLYLGLARFGLTTPGAGGVASFLAVGVLAFVGGLAVVCFVRIVGIVFLGTARSDAASHAHESSASILGPMAFLAAACVALAVLPGPAIAAAGRVVSGLTAAAPIAPLDAASAPVRSIGLANAVLFGALSVSAAALALALRGRASARAGTWGCGYVAPTARMQYTSRSFAEILTSRLIPRFFRPESTIRRPAALFPPPGDFRSAFPDPVTKKAWEPFFTRWADRFARLRWLQQGELHIYIVYILAAVVLGLGWATVHTWRGNL